MKRAAFMAAMVCVIAGLGPSLRAGQMPTTRSVPQAAPGAVIIQIQGEIDEYNRDALFRRFDEARQLGAKVVILNIDTYGGLLTAGLEISRYIKREDDIHTIAFVQDKAISAGAMIAMSCDEIVMSSSSSLGDCAPIIFGPQGLETMAPAERAKAESPVLEDFAESARRNHHDPLLAAAMVDVKRVVYWVQNQKGERQFVDEKQYAALKGQGWTDVPNAPVPIDGPETLLAVDGQQAVQYGLASGQAPTARSLAEGRGYTIIADLTPGWGENLVQILGSAAVRGLLIIVFLQCLYFVLHAPGHGVAEVLGLLALALMLGVPMLNGYAQWWEILTIFLGLGLVAVEIALPGHMIPGVTGAVMVLIGLLMTFVPKEPGGLPSVFSNFHSTWLALRTGIMVMALALSSSLLLWYWMGRFLPRMPYINRLILTTTSGGRLNMPAGPGPSTRDLPAAEASARNSWPPIGAIGRAVTELKPGGSAEFFDAALADGRITSVVSERGYIAPGAEVVVRVVDGPSIIVRPRV